jgi:hypothetical protein
MNDSNLFHQLKIGYSGHSVILYKGCRFFLCILSFATASLFVFNSISSSRVALRGDQIAKQRAPKDDVAGSPT